MSIACPICGGQINSDAWSCVHCDARKGYSLSLRGPTGIFGALWFMGQMVVGGGVFFMLAAVFHKTWLWALGGLCVLGLVAAILGLLREPRWFAYEKSWDEQPSRGWGWWSWFSNDD